MMEYRIIKSAIFGNKVQKLLAFFTIFLASMLIASMLNITLGIGDKVAGELRGYGSNIIVIPRGGALSMDINGEEFKPLQNDVFLDERDIGNIKNIFWRNNIAGFAPFLEGKVTDKDAKDWDIVGTYFNKNVKIPDEDNFFTGIKIIYPLIKVDGEWIADDSLDEVLVGEDLASKLGIKTGDTLEFDGYKLKIVGILSGMEKADNKIITSLLLAQKLLDKENKISWAEVSALTVPEDDLSVKARRSSDSLDAVEYDKWYCTAYVGSIAFQIEEEYKGASAKALMKTSEGESLVVKKIQSLMGVVSIIALAAASIGISSLIASEINRRKKEIGLLKALGANTLSIYLLFLAETLIVAIFAGIIGAFAGYGMSALIAISIFGHPIGISPIVLPLTLSFAVVIAIIGSLIPIRSVVNLLPAEVLYERK